MHRPNSRIFPAPATALLSTRKPPRSGSTIRRISTAPATALLSLAAAFSILVGDSRAETAPTSAAVAAQVACGDAVGASTITAADALFALRTAVGTQTCELCLCDADGSTTITAVDALRILNKAVGIDVDLLCAACANGSPTVDAGEPQTIPLDTVSGAATATLAATVGDDGLPIPPSTLTLLWTLVSGPTMQAAVEFEDESSASTTVTFGEVGTFTLRLAADDGEAEVADTVEITVTAAQNLPPSLLPLDDAAIDLGATLSVRATADDDNPVDALVYSLVEAPAGASLDPAASGRILWTPGAAEELGAHEFTVRVEDQGGLFDEEIFTVTVMDANRAPTLSPLDNETIPAGLPYERLLAAVDPDAGDALAYEIIDAPPAMSLGGVNNDTLTWATTNADVGVHAVKLRVVDSGSPSLDDAAMFLLTVHANTVPAAGDDAYEVGEGETLVVDADGVLANDADPDGDPIAAMKLSDPDLGTVTAFSADGGFTYEAPAEAPDPAFAIAEKWRGGGHAQAVYALPLVGDINEDGYPDIIRTGFDGNNALNGLDGSQLWASTADNGQGLVISDCAQYLAGNNATVLADIDDDDDLEYVTAVACGRDGGNGAIIDRLVAYDKTGKPKWLSPRISRPHPDARPPGGGETQPDPLLYPYFGLTGPNPSVARLAPDATPTLLVRVKIPSLVGVYTKPDGTAGYAGCRALTGRPEDEGIACRATVLLSGLDGSVQEVLTTPNPGDQSSNFNWYPWKENSPFAADLEGDGSVEILSGSDVWKRVDDEWTLAWQTELEPAEVAVADLDGDGVMEVIHLVNREGDGNPATRFGGYVIFRADGTELRRLTISPMYYPGWFTVADLDGDGTPDILDSVNGFVHAMRPDGRVLWVYALPPVPGFPGTTQTRSGLTSAQVYDLDGDGVREVVVVGVYGLHILDGRTGVEKASYVQSAEAGFAFFTGSIVADVDNDGHTDIVVVSRRGATNCNDLNTPPDCNIVAVIEGAANDWVPGPKIFHQTQFRVGDVDDSGHVLFNTTVTDSFRNPAQLGEPADPREAMGTSFTYAATDGASDSDPATVFLEITPANRPPVITSIPPSAFLSVWPYTRPVYPVTAVDPDPGDTITYELVVNGHPFAGSFPTAMNIDSVTGELSLYTGSCGSYGGPCAFYPFLVVVAAVDQLGARSEQSFTLSVSYTTTTVPDVVGDGFDEAVQALEDLKLRGGLLTEAYSNEPAGTVIAQGIAPSTVVVIDTTVQLTVSLGRAPVVVPNVVGLPETVATGTLEDLAFAVDVSRAYSTTAPRGEVTAQAPAAGETVVPADAAVTVSLGSGIVVRLSRDYATSNQTIDVEVIAVGTDDEEAPLSDADLVVEPVDAFHLGATPTVAGSTITPAMDTRGTWRVIATDPDNGRSGSAEFTVVQPADDETNIDAAAFAGFSETLNGVLALLREASEAGALGDDETVEAKAEEAVLLWRSFDQGALRWSSPFAMEDGLPPRPSDMSAFGVFESAEDELHVEVLEGVVAAVDALVEGLRDEHTLLPELSQLLADVMVASAPLESTAPGEYGHVAAQPEYAVLASHMIPDAIDALMNDLGETVGLEPLPPTELDASSESAALLAGLLSTEPGLEATGRSAGVRRPRPRSTIAEQLTVLAVNTVVEHMNTLKKIHGDVMKQAFSGVFLVGVASHLRAALNTTELVEVVSGASLSFRRFYAPYTIVEGFGFDTKYPQLNEVILLGPDTVGPGIELFEAIKGAKFDTLWNSAKTGLDGLKKIKDFNGAGDEVYANGLQRTHFADAPCIFTTAPGCSQLIFPNGFYSVYSYEPPPGFGTFVGIPLPIIMLVRSGLTGEYSFATPPFIPYKPGQEL